MLKFPSIEAPRHVFPSIIRATQFTHLDHTTQTPCYDTTVPLPVLTFRGTVKLHGSNAAIVQTADAAGIHVHFQSRERILSRENDLMGFCAHMSAREAAVKGLFEGIARARKDGAADGCTMGGRAEKDIKAIAVFGEWCGTGIQKGVALSQLPKMFVVFAIKIVYAGEGEGETSDEWLDMDKFRDVKDEDARIFNVMQFATYSVVIDFKDEESLAEAKRKVEELTLSVEDECPVGKYFGVEGVGEGIVWQAVQSPSLPVFNDGQYCKSRFWFKTKGVKHTSNQKPAGAKAPKAALDPEETAKIDAFVELVATPARLQQGLQVLEREMLLPLEMNSIGVFIKWVIGDVLKEEYDRIEEAGISQKALMGPVTAAAKRWYVEQLDIKTWQVEGVV